jgi:hypothetical protein
MELLSRPSQLSIADCRLPAEAELSSSLISFRRSSRTRSDGYQFDLIADCQLPIVD